MKKLFALVIMVALTQGLSLFAQQSSIHKESDFYYYNVNIEKIYAHRLGYIVMYRKGVNNMASMYIPASWFADTGGKGELVALGPGADWPSMTLYYNKGEFSHVRLFLRPRNHQTWGTVPLNFSMDERFEGIDALKLEF